MPPPQDADELRGFLSDRDVPCPGCGYNLRGLTGGRCPECNQELALQVGLVERRMALWLGAVVGLAFGTGFNALLLAYVTISALVIRRSFSGARPILVHDSIGLVVEGVLLLLILRHGRAVRRWSLRARLLACVVAWLLTVANAVSFAYVVK